MPFSIPLGPTTYGTHYKLTTAYVYSNRKVSFSAYLWSAHFCPRFLLSCCSSETEILRAVVSHRSLCLFTFIFFLLLPAENSKINGWGFSVIANSSKIFSSLALYDLWSVKMSLIFYMNIGVPIWMVTEIYTALCVRHSVIYEFYPLSNTVLQLSCHLIMINN